MQRIFSILILIFTINSVQCQVCTNGWNGYTFLQNQGDVDQIQMKYWDYRHRFWDKFIEIPNVQYYNLNTLYPGTFMPAVARNENKQIQAYFPSYDYQNNVFMPNRSVNGTLKWADNGYVMGTYIAVLATEWKLFKNQGKNAEAANTLKELAGVIQAFERLDLAIDGELNGFFYRDDVPGSFQFHGMKYPPDDKPNIVIPPETPKDYYQIQSDYAFSVQNYYGIQEVCTGQIPFLQCKDECKEDMTSVDQVIGMMLGLALVIKLIPQNKFYYNGIKNYRPRFEAEQHIYRMVGRYKSDGWRLFNNKHFCFVDGVSPIFIAYGFCAAAQEVTGGNCGIMAQDAISKALFPITWQNAYFPIGYLSNNIPSNQAQVFYNWRMIMDLGALSNNFVINPSPLLVGPCNIHGINVTKNKIGKYIKDNYIMDGANSNSTRLTGDYCEMLDLYRDVLHGGGTYYNSQFFFDILNSAPCEGPNWNGPTGWTSHDRWTTLNFVYGNEKHDTQEGYYYNGLDYMLLYNLYHLQFTPSYDYRDMHEEVKNLGQLTFPQITTTSFPNRCSSSHGHPATVTVKGALVWDSNLIPPITNYIAISPAVYYSSGRIVLNHTPINESPLTNTIRQVTCIDDQPCCPPDPCQGIPPPNVIQKGNYNFAGYVIFKAPFVDLLEYDHEPLSILDIDDGYSCNSTTHQYQKNSTNYLSEGVLEETDSLEALLAQMEQEAQLEEKLLSKTYLPSFTPSSNPFSTTLNLIFSLPSENIVKIRITDALGVLVYELTKSYELGEHKLEWDTSTSLSNPNSSLSNPSGLPSGLYFVQFSAGDFHEIKKVIKN